MYIRIFNYLEYTNLYLILSILKNYIVITIYYKKINLARN